MDKDILQEIYDRLNELERNEIQEITSTTGLNITDYRTYHPKRITISLDDSIQLDLDMIKSEIIKLNQVNRLLVQYIKEYVHIENNKI